MSTQEKFAEYIINGAQNGSPEHQYTLGIMYFKGKFIEQDYKKAVYWLKKAYSEYPLAAAYLAKCYMNGYEVTKDIQKAIFLYQESIEAGSDIGYYDLACCYKNGIGVKPDIEYSEYLMIKSAELGYCAAQEKAGFIFKKRENHIEAVKWFQRAAKQDNPTALFEMSRYYILGKCVDKDTDKGIEFMKRAADLGCVEALIYMGIQYQEGNLFKKDAAKALKLLRKAVILNDEQEFSSDCINIAYCSLGEFYLYGTEVTRNYTRAVFWFSMAAKLGDTQAIFFLALCCYMSYGTPEYTKNACNIILEYAKNEVPEAEFIIGYFHMHGQIIPRDYNTAISWLEKSVMHGYKDASKYICECKRLKANYNTDAKISVNNTQSNTLTKIKSNKKKSRTNTEAPNQFNTINNSYNNEIKKIMQSANTGNSVSQNKLGELFEKGNTKNNIHQNYREAVLWYKKAAVQGLAQAQYNLGRMYYNGTGTEQSFLNAFYWYDKAAMQGSTDAKCNIAYMYEHGQGIEKNSLKALRWYKEAAMQGSVKAQYQLACMYNDGIVIKRSLPDAFKWYKLSAEKGNTASQYKLGYMYEVGEGVKKNRQLAYQWYKKAADGGFKEAVNKLKNFSV